MTDKPDTQRRDGPITQPPPPRCPVCGDYNCRKSHEAPGFPVD